MIFKNNFLKIRTVKMTDKNILIQRIMNHLVKEDDYKRMIDYECDGIDISMSYDDFILYNKKCLKELSYDDLRWDWGLCKRLNRKVIGLMDLECCAIFMGSYIFYDNNKNIVVVNPR